MSEPSVFDRTYALARLVQRRTYAATGADDFESLAECARELARMLDRCALAAESADHAFANGSFSLKASHIA